MKGDPMLTDNENFHLAVVEHMETHQFHGALYRRHDTPSGLERWHLANTTMEGYDTVSEAVDVINRSFPGLKPLDMISRFSEEEPAHADD